MDIGAVGWGDVDWIPPITYTLSPLISLALGVCSVVEYRFLKPN
jgi:hypothetical protein